MAFFVEANRLTLNKVFRKLETIQNFLFFKTKTTNFLQSKNIKVMHHLPYSPDVTPCNFWLFPQLKINLRGCSFKDCKDVLIAIDKFFISLRLEHFQKTFEK